MVDNKVSLLEVRELYVRLYNIETNR